MSSAANTSLIVDFDLRKTIVRDSVRSESNFRFATKSEVQNAIRITEENKYGEISGKVNMLFTSDNDKYIFIYKKGEFNALQETSGQGTSKILFANAVTSAKINSDGSYKLCFLEEGSYEIHLASFTENNSKSTFTGLLNATSISSGVVLNNINISSKSQAIINIMLQDSCSKCL